MKKFYLLMAILAVAVVGFAQATDLIISEYIEGSGSNKALEIYNGTGSDVDLSGYQLWRVSNGGSWPEATVALSGTLSNGDVYVVANSSANAAILAVADLTTGFVSWNGDDAVGLAKDDGTGTFVLIDAVGEDGADPGSGWDVAGVTNATRDHTLVRKSTVCSPNTDWDASQGTNTTDSEWIVYGQDEFSYLGSHTASCGGGGSTAPDNPANFDATAVSTTEIDLTWAQNAAGNDVMVAWSSDGTFGTPNDGTDYSVGDVLTGGGSIIYNGNGTSFNHTGLSANTNYYYKAWSVDATTDYSTGVTDNAKTNHGGTVKLPNHWTGDSGIDTYKALSTVHGGSAACEIVVNTGSQSSCDFSNEVGVTVTPGETFTYSFWMWPSSHVRGRIIVDFYRGDGTYLSSSYGGYSAGSGAWEQVAMSGTVPTDAATAKVRVRFYDQSGFVAGESQFVDDFTFESPTGTVLSVANGDLESWSSTPVVPLSDWAVALAFMAMISFVLIRYKF